MNQKEKKCWRINIENAVAEATAKAGTEIVKSVFRRYDARNLYDLSPCYYSEVFADLQQIIND
ncbi:MAG: hypothetical protein CW335_06615 [Clostridiales bacterium]|nr:hypothetical protein [Clostridiales bacterium]